MELLPDAGERAHLLDSLAQLILVAGSDTFLSFDLVEPTDKWFPDPWTADAPAVQRLLARLLDYIELDHLQLRLEIDRFADAQGEVLMDGRAGGHSGTAAWYAGIRGGVCSFGVDTNQLRDPMALVGTLAHEVAHTYRDVHELRINDPAIDEPLTDLTTVYLGLGILTVNSSQRFRTGGDHRGTWHSRSEGGYLRMQSMTYLLAAHTLARGTPTAQVARHVPANQRACLKAAVADLGARAAVLERLGLPPIARPERAAQRGWLRRLFGRG